MQSNPVIAWWSSLAARGSHKPEVGGSNPPRATNFSGGVAERLKAAVLKTDMLETASKVQILPPPPFFI